MPQLLSHLQSYLTLRQERQPIALSHGAEEIALLSVDTVRASGSATEEECRWSELEIEFLDTVSSETRNRAASELAEWLATQAGVTPAGQSKAARAAELLSIPL